ncbi:MAG: Usg family protein [Alphaproteobacteria bacterium]|nr:Usg family protein [Alphaproteobacteria bacterium]
MPDHPALLQTFLWQEFDIAPKFPELTRFLKFWTENLDGPLYKVRVASKALLTPAELTLRDGEFALN